MALSVFGLIAAAVTLIAVVESYSNLYAFALDHDLHNWRAAFAPAAVDSFVIMGELLLFAALLLQWTAKLPYVLGGAMALWGFALSVGGNVWHVPDATIADRAVSAIWPVTATAGLAGGLIIAKRLIADRRPATTAAASSGKPREPRQEPLASRRAARAPELAAVKAGDLAQLSEAEQAIVLDLLGRPVPWPGEQKLARQAGIPRRRARRVLDAARATQNGGGHGEHQS